MSRTKTGVVRHQKHQKVLSQTKGFKGANNRLFKRAHEALLHAGQYAYNGRKLRKRDFRSLWINRISAGLKTLADGLKYSRFIKLLADKKIILNRKMLAELAINEPKTFTKIVDQVK